MPQELKRTTFETWREAEYFDVDELRKQTTQPPEKFGDVVIKELADNALDAAETAGVTPCLDVAVTRHTDLVEISVCDNGPGIDLQTVQKVQNFTTRTSDKAAYRSPTRGAQGNALKTVIGIPHALGCSEPVVIEAKGIRHIIKPHVDPAGRVKLPHEVKPSDRQAGTKVTVSLPKDRVSLDPTYWANAISLFNPHAFVNLEQFEESIDHAEWVLESAQIYKATLPNLTKYKPTDPTSPHWYTPATLERLIGAHIGHAQDGGRDLPLGEFVRQFKGLTSSAKAKQVTRHLSNIEHLSDFENDGRLDGLRISLLLKAMKDYTTPPTHKALGRIGKEHFEQRFEEMYAVKRFGYKHLQGYFANGLPYTFEFAVAETFDCHTDALFYGVNYSPTFDDPLADVRFRGPRYAAIGVRQFLIDGCAHPAWRLSDDPGPHPYTAVAVHIITPAPMFMEKGKTKLAIRGGV